MWSLFVALLCALVFGAVLHLLYDAVRVLRILCGVRYPGTVGERLRARPLPLLPMAWHGSRAAIGARWVQNGIIFLTDVLFCLIAGALFSLFVYWQNDGEFRAVLLLGAVVGYTLFHVTFGRLLLSCSTVVAFLGHALFAYVFWLLRFPFLLFYRAIIMAGQWLVHLLLRLLCVALERLVLPHQSRRQEKQRLACAYRDLPP